MAKWIIKSCWTAATAGIHRDLYNDPEGTLVELRNAALAYSRIQKYLADVSAFHGTLVTNAVDEILAHRDEHGIYQSLTNVPKHFGGTGEDAFSWCLCDAPLLLLALLKAGMDYREYVKPGVDYLVSLCRDNGFPCAASPELGKFRGPGKKDDCCLACLV